MRSLVVLRGAPGAGKSTWIKQNHFEQYTLCPDDIRVMCNSYTPNLDDTLTIARNQNTEAMTWKILFELLEYRMSRGEFTIIDATASKTKDMQQYKALAEQYRYRLYCVDFTQVPIETCLLQNKQRPEYKWVPEKGIRNIYARFKTQQIPSGYTVIKPDEIKSLLEEPFDLSNYKKIVFIGDIHGCFDTLMQYPDFKEGLKDDTEYIFLGDYIDRGNQNAEVMHWLNSIMNKPNVCLLEGNHEIYLRDFGSSVPVTAAVFKNQTQPQLIAGGYTPKMARMFYRKCRQMSHFTYNGLDILACHGGIHKVPMNYSFVPTQSFILGTGSFKESNIIAQLWMRDSAQNQFLIHGHRNELQEDIQVADRVFNLEGGVEAGGALRIVELDTDLNWKTVELESCQPIAEVINHEQHKVESVEEAISYLRANTFVQEKQLTDTISSFNFTRDAFFKSNWNQQTILARGLFMDTKSNKIMARSYEKFFRINEVPETKIGVLHNKFQFPVTAYLKENGFLAIVSYDYINDDLFIASKSTNTGDYVGYIKNQLVSIYSNVLKYLKAQYEAGEAVTLVFECEDIEHDPHIIKYSKNNLVLLDVIKNDLKYQTDIPLTSYNSLKAPTYYGTLVNLADSLGCSVKKRAYVFDNWDQFLQFYMELELPDYQYEDNYVEGFVFEDASGFMTKCKSGYYNTWKQLRGVADQTLRLGHYSRTGSLQTPIANLFYGFCRKLFNIDRDLETKSYPYKTDIISLRDKFYKEELLGKEMVNNG